jgi:hypothetical protein
VAGASADVAPTTACKQRSGVVAADAKSMYCERPSPRIEESRRSSDVRPVPQPASVERLKHPLLEGWPLDDHVGSAGFRRSMGMSTPRASAVAIALSYPASA